MRQLAWDHPSTPVKAAKDVDARYLDLLKRALTGTAGTTYDVFIPGARLRRVYQLLQWLLARRGLELLRRSDPAVSAQGIGWTAIGETMVGMERLEQIETCVADIMANDVPGDFIETGVWRGGASIFMRALLDVHGDTERTVWLADSFAGLPKPDPERYPADRGDRIWQQNAILAVSLEQVRANFARHGFLDERVRFLPGWFRDTLPNAPVERLAILRLDGDIYESTMVALDALYDRLSIGGYVIVDDYALPTCMKAVTDFRHKREISDPIVPVDWTGIYWRKSG